MANQAQPKEIANNPALTGAPNTEASARTLEELAYMASTSGEETAAAVLMDLAVRADMHASRRISFAHQGVPGLGLPMGGMPTIVGGKNNLDGGLSKALAKSAFRPRRTPYKINPTLYAIGAYDGIRDPAAATQMTMRIQQNIARHPIMHAIIETRVRQIAPYCKVARGPNDMGFEVSLRNEKQSMSRAARKKQEEIQDILLHGGLHRDPWGKRRRHSYTGEPGVWDGNEEDTSLPLADAMESETRDLLTCGWSCSRIEAADGDAERFPITFYSPVDSTMIRLTEQEQYGQPKIDDRLKVVKYVEMAPDNPLDVFREYAWDMMSVMLYRRRMDWFGRGYGDGLIDIVIDVIAAMSDGLQFCKEFYDNSHLPFGILEFSGFPMLAAEQYLQSIKQEMLRSGGKGNWWNVISMMFPMGPNGQSGGVDFKPFRGEAASEMSGIPGYWSLLNTILHAACLIDPNETGFESHTTQTSSLQEADPGTIIEQSHKKGYKPLLEKHQARRTNDVVWRIDEDFEMRFVNVEGEDQKKKEELAALKMARGWTPDKVSDSFDEELKYYPLDPVLYGQVEAKYSEEDFDTHEDYFAVIVADYEDRCKKKGYVKFWSGAGALPVLCPPMMEIIQAEQAENQQATQPPGMMPDGQMQPGVAPDGQMMPDQMQPGQEQMQPGQIPGQEMAGPAALPGQNANDGQDANGAQDNGAQLQGADLRPHHLLTDQSEPNQGEAPDDEEERRKRYAAALKQRLLQKAQARQAVQ